MGFDELLQPLGRGQAVGSLQFFAACQFYLRRQAIAPRDKAADSGAFPHDAAMLGQLEGCVFGCGNAAGAGFDLAGHDLVGGSAQGLAVNAFSARVGHEHQSCQAADKLAFHHHFAFCAY